MNLKKLLIKDREVQETSVLHSSNRGEQAYYFEHLKFTDRMEDLWLTLEEKFYSHKIILLADRQVQIIAIPFEEGLKSHTSSVFFDDRNNYFDAIVCASQLAEKIELPAPEIVNDKLQCPLDTITIN